MEGLGDTQGEHMRSLLRLLRTNNKPRTPLERNRSFEQLLRAAAPEEIERKRTASRETGRNA